MQRTSERTTGLFITSGENLTGREGKLWGPWERCRRTALYSFRQAGVAVLHCLCIPPCQGGRPWFLFRNCKSFPDEQHSLLNVVPFPSSSSSFSSVICSFWGFAWWSHMCRPFHRSLLSRAAVVPPWAPQPFGPLCLPLAEGGQRVILWAAL